MPRDLVGDDEGASPVLERALLASGLVDGVDSRLAGAIEVVPIVKLESVRQRLVGTGGDSEKWWLKIGDFWSRALT